VDKIIIRRELDAQGHGPPAGSGRTVDCPEGSLRPHGQGRLPKKNRAGAAEREPGGILRGRRAAARAGPRSAPRAARAVNLRMAVARGGRRAADTEVQAACRAQTPSREALTGSRPLTRLPEQRRVALTLPGPVLPEVL
jgi:hypothetical protein